MSRESPRTVTRDGKEPEPNKNEQHQNPDFAKNRTLPRKHRTEPEPKCHGSYSGFCLNETVGTFTHFTVNETFYFYHTNQVQLPA